MRNTILFLLLSFTFSSCDRTSEKDSYYLYLEEILGKSPDESKQYVLVSDYSCSSCKEQVYREIEEKANNKVYIILQPRNKLVLRERFQDAIFENRLFIDTSRLNLEMNLVMDKAMELDFQEGKWILLEMEGEL
ncbi:hypothetical protein [Cecembia calidifontis]|uniref:Uncharacterized protein n=1 Tax=Cecembia calidifontis TaxID=1187080 RepID=A0A4Q7P7R6_9BACT|nr:hypothetical protein [Cecembia calidifontis]RZS96111.1 hypothetical protein BC751_1669 [Cecembia calidifontis]